jgi:hypothetical protein
VNKKRQKNQQLPTGREAGIKNSKWHFHRDPQEGILIQDLEKNNSRNIVPTI